MAVVTRNMARRDAVLIGCGDRGRVHAEALAASDRFDLAAVCDLDPGLARSAAAEFDVPGVHTDLDEAIAAVDPVHVSLVTPATVRESAIAAVLAHDPPSLLFEKPVATTFEEVQAVADLVAASATTVTVGHQHVFTDEIQAVGGWLDAGRIGDVERLLGTTKGGLFEHGTHFLHTVGWLLDAAPERVRAHAEWGEHPFFEDWHADVEPTDALVELSYPDSRRAVLHLGPDAPDVPAQAEDFWLQYRLDVVGTAGHARFVLGDHAAVRDDDGAERVGVDGFDTGGYATRRCYDRLADVLAGDRDRHPSDFASALDAHRTVEAALRSAAEGRAVALAEL